MNQGLLICITGIDGSGKTTLAKLILNKYLEKGIIMNYVHNRYIPFFMKPIIFFARAFVLRDNDMFLDYHKDTNKKQNIFKNHKFSQLYEFGIIIDYSIQSFIRISLPRIIFKANIITDRHIYDTICTDLAVDLNYSDERVKERLKKYFILFSKPDISFLIDISEEIAFSRKDDVPAIDYLKERRKKYLLIESEYNLIKIDGSKPSKDVCMNVTNNLDKLIL